MNMLWISVFLCLAATVASQTTSTLMLSTVDANWNFTVAVNSSGSVSFTRNTSPYAVLGNLGCTVGQYPQWSGSAWTCGTNTALTSDPLGAIASSCYNNGSKGLQNVPSSNGVSFSSCAADADSLSLLSCSAGQLPTRSGSADACKNDSDYISSAATNCGTGGTPRFAASSFGCTVSFTDADTANTLLSTCTSGQTLKFTGSAWACGADLDLLSNPCSNGQILVSTGSSSWTCSTDADVLGNLASSCTGTKDTPQFTTSGGWICIDSPVISLSAPVAQTMLTATFLAPSNVYVPSSTSFTGVSGIPYYLTNSTTVKAWTLRNLGSATDITATLWSGSTPVSSVSLTSFTYNHVTVVGASASTPGLVGVQLLNTGSVNTYITVDIFVELSLA